MNIHDYLLNYQPPLYQTFSRALFQGHLSHAYLLHGEPGTPLKEVALYLAASLVCEAPHPLACETCLSCSRIADGSYVDFYMFDGDEGSIKKERILDLESAFARTSVEKAGRLIYVIHKVEKMTPEAINSLLKFLEEPNDNVFAILTTENEARVLPTIISRVQNLPLKLIPRDTLINETVKLDIPLVDIELLSLVVNLPTTIEKLSEDDTYLKVKDTLLLVLDQLALSAEEGVYASMKIANKAINSRDEARLYLQMLLAFFQDIVNYNLQGSLYLPSLVSYTSRLAKHFSTPLQSIKTIIEAITRIDSNVNINLLLDHVFIHIAKESTHE